jgi:hypothetical protein
MLGKFETLARMTTYRSHLEDFQLFSTLHQFFTSLCQVSDQLQDELEFEVNGLETDILTFKEGEYLNELEIEIATRLSLWRQALEKFDSDLSASALRQYFEQVTIPDTNTLEIILSFYLSKSVKTSNDRDKIDLIATWWGQLLLKQEEIAVISLSQLPIIRERLEKIYLSFGLTPMPVSEARDAIEILEFERKRLLTVRSLRELIEKQVLLRLRKLKSGLGDLLFQPAILTEIVALNIDIRSTFRSLFLAEQSRLANFFQPIPKTYSIEAVEKTLDDIPIEPLMEEYDENIQIPRVDSKKLDKLGAEIVAQHLSTVSKIDNNITLDKTELLKVIQSIRSAIQILDKNLEPLLKKLNQ